MNKEILKHSQIWIDNICNVDYGGWSCPRAIIVPISDDRVDIYFNDCDGTLLYYINENRQLTDYESKIFGSFSKRSLIVTKGKLEFTQSLIDKYFSDEYIQVFTTYKKDNTDKYFKNLVKDLRYEVSIVLE